MGPITRCNLNQKPERIQSDVLPALLEDRLSMPKSTTKRIVLFEPDQEQLKHALEDRELSPDLIAFLENLLKTKKWTRKINIPSGQDDLAAVLVFTTALREAGLEILSELHVYYAGRVMVEKWQVVGEEEQISLLPKEAFHAIDIDKVRVQDGQVTIEVSAPIIGGHSGTLIKTFDFAVEGSGIRFVSHPLLETRTSDAERSGRFD
jgi:hypothetical protein